MPVTAAEFCAREKYPVVFWWVQGQPEGYIDAGDQPEVELPFSLEGIDGEVVDGKWEWDGDGDVRDSNENSIRQITVYFDQRDYRRAIEEYLS